MNIAGLKSIYRKLINTVFSGLLCLLAGCSPGEKTEEIKPSDGEAVVPASTRIIKADYAHSIGITGEGALVAVIDTGAATHLPDIAPNLSDASMSVITNTDDVTDGTGHGTAVASILAAAKNNLGIKGVAYDAKLLIIKTDEPAGTFIDDRIRMAIDYAIKQEAHIINMSLAGEASSQPKYDQALERAVEKGLLTVISAGNSGAETPQQPAISAGKFAGLGEILIVGAVDNTGQIASFSNRAGAFKDLFIVAPGVDIDVLTRSGEVHQGSGTSFSSPQVAAGAALIKQHAPHLNGKEMANVLLESAQDLGEPGVDEVYGHGLLDVKAALQPLGAGLIPSSLVSDYGQIRASQAYDKSVFHGAIGFSSNIISDPLFAQAIMLDRYGRAFPIDLREKQSRQSALSSAAQWLYVDPVTVKAPDSRIREVPFLGQVHVFAGVLPQKWRKNGLTARHESLQTEGTLALNSYYKVRRDLNARKALVASVGLPLSAQTGIYALNQDLNTSIASLTAVHALENPYLSFSTGDLGLSYSDKLSERFAYQFSLGLKSNRLASTRYDGEGRDLAKFEDNRSQQYVANAEVTYRYNPKLGLSFNAGYLVEDGRMLNSYGAGAFGFDKLVQTGFVGSAFSWDYKPNLSFHGTLAAGVTKNLAQSYGLIRNMRSIRSQAFSFALNATNTPFKKLFGGEQDDLSLVLSQPLRLSSGQILIDVPVARNNAGVLIRRQKFLRLEPSGRQLDLELAYGFSLRTKPYAPLNHIGLMFGITHQPNHDHNAHLETRVGLKFKRRF